MECSRFFLLYECPALPRRRDEVCRTEGLSERHGSCHLSLEQGCSFRKAHEIIGNAVRLGLESGRELEQLPLEELRNLSDQFAEDFFAAITLEATLDCHDVIGGTARTRVKGALEGAGRQIESDRASLASKKSAKLGVERAALV